MTTKEQIINGTLVTSTRAKTASVSFVDPAIIVKVPNATARINYSLASTSKLDGVDFQSTEKLRFKQLSTDEAMKPVKVKNDKGDWEDGAITVGDLITLLQGQAEFWGETEK